MSPADICWLRCDQPGVFVRHDRGYSILCREHRDMTCRMDLHKYEIIMMTVGDLSASGQLPIEPIR